MGRIRRRDEASALCDNFLASCACIILGCFVAMEFFLWEQGSPGPLEGLREVVCIVEGSCGRDMPLTVTGRGP